MKTKITPDDVLSAKGLDNQWTYLSVYDLQRLFFFAYDTNIDEDQIKACYRILNATMSKLIIAFDMQKKHETKAAGRAKVFNIIDDFEQEIRLVRLAGK